MRWTWGWCLVGVGGLVAGQVGHGVRVFGRLWGSGSWSRVGAVVGGSGLGGCGALALFGGEGQWLLTAEAKRSTIAERWRYRSGQLLRKYNGRRSSATSGGCRRFAGSYRRRSHGGWPWSPASTAPVSSTPSSSTHPPTTSAAHQSPAESPTLGLSHLQFEALLTAARDSPNVFDFALVTMLGLLGMRIFEACGADIIDIGEEHGHRGLHVLGKGPKLVLVPLPPRNRPRTRPRCGLSDQRPNLAQPLWPAHGSTLRHPPTSRPRQGIGGAPAADARPRPDWRR